MTAHFLNVNHLQLHNSIIMEPILKFVASLFFLFVFVIRRCTSRADKTAAVGCCVAVIMVLAMIVLVSFIASH